MYKYILEQAGDINWMAMFSLTTFFFVFSISLILALRKDKKHIEHMAHIPLDDYQATTENAIKHEN